ncbi:unnamed protein product [Protopolystoma xenopodis]|uniref:Uncharacterized protein n=1 Tax=Protopolystoma xenopodis TaxID=117903 RepID=A0A448X7S1_9PLAT|nr:unnamed protein product [Protopolystoma xenopodis]
MDAGVVKRFGQVGLHVIPTPWLTSLVPSQTPSRHQHDLIRLPRLSSVWSSCSRLLCAKSACIFNHAAIASLSSRLCTGWTNENGGTLRRPPSTGTCGGILQRRTLRGRGVEYYRLLRRVGTGRRYLTGIGENRSECGLANGSGRGIWSSLNCSSRSAAGVEQETPSKSAVTPLTPLSAYSWLRRHHVA